MKGFNPNSLEESLQNTFYFVEADSFSTHALWYMHVYRPDPNHGPIEYEKISQGFFKMIDDVNCISFSFSLVYGKLVCFYHVTSSKQDWEQVADYMEPYWYDLKTQTRRKCDAMNFYHCIHACKE